MICGRKFNFKDFTFWHLWFAWHPVRLDDGRHAWLENVERRIEYHYSGEDYYYRPIER